ncbi:MAG TPA: hypothetical protein VJ044_05735, partial [Candidatus Hodarchaeales archaeon]|nr:hypothetical protein [Candidatus Hodarchaeales archaeon]
MSKRGQITLFIIIGILLLLTLGIFIYLQQVALVKPIEERLIPIVAEVPTMIAPVREFIATCAAEIAKEGLRKMGDQGGYLETPGSINPYEPTEGDAVMLSEDLIIPYWWYLKSKNKCEGECEFTTNKPELYREQGIISIEGQLDEFVEDHIDLCLRDFQNFREQGFIIEEKEPLDVQSTIATDRVFVLVKYPLIVKKGDISYEFSDSVAELDVNLGEIFNLGIELVNLQAENGFFERHTRNIIDAFSDIDKNALPPVSDMLFKFGPSVIWIKFKIQEQLKELLATYTQFLQVFGVRNYRLIDAPTGQVTDPDLFRVLYNRGMIIPLNTSHPSPEVTFSYLDFWKPYIDLNCRGQLC